MNIIFVSDDSREADILKRELAERSPAVKIETTTNIQDTMARIATSVPCDVILLDISIPVSDAINLATNIREDKKPIGIVSLVDASENNPPLDLLKAGVDNFVLKRTGYVSALPDALKHAKARRQSNQATQPKRIRLLFVGDFQIVNKLALIPPNITIEAVPFNPDGRIRLPETVAFQDEALIIDGTALGPHTLDSIRDVNLHTPDIPVMLLTAPGDEETSIQAMRAGASDCIVKTETWFQRLLPAIERENRRRELQRVKNALRIREERLRQIVETIPVGITLIAPDGAFLAVNREGLKLMGSQRPEQVIGKNFLKLLPQQEREKVKSFLANVCNGTDTSTSIDWSGFDGTISGFELSAVSMRKDASGIVAALAVIYPPKRAQTGQAIDEETQRKMADLRKALAESESLYRDLQSQSSLRETEWAQTLQQVEASRTEAEQQQAILKSAIEDAKTRYKNLLEEQAAERAQWEQARQSLKEQRAKIESMAESLRSAQERLHISNAAEQSQWEIKIQELEENARLVESQKVQLEAALHKSESTISQQKEALATERSRADALRQELEKKTDEIESQRVAFETALSEAESHIAQQDEALAAERSRAAALRQELEKKTDEIESQRVAFETALNEAESHIAQQDEALAAERSRAAALRQELETKIQEIDSQRAAVESAIHDAETLSTERFHWETTRQELEQKLRKTESERDSLQIALEELEAHISQQADKHASECSQWDLARLELEQKCLSLEQRQAILQKPLQEAEAALLNAVAEYNSRCAHLQAMSLGLEQHYQNLDQQQEKLKSVLQELKPFSAQTLKMASSAMESVEQKPQYVKALHNDALGIETDLEALKRKHQELSRFNPAGMVLATIEGVVLSYNAAAAQMFDFPEKITPDRRFRLYAFEGALQDCLQQSGKLENIRWTAMKRNGRLVHVREYAQLMTSSTGEPLCVERILADISKTHPQSEEIRHARRLEATNELAAATVRRLQELCASLAQSCAQLRQFVGDDTLVHEVAVTLENSVTLGIKNARQFFAFAQKTDRAPELLDLNKVLEDNRDLLRNLAGDPIDLQPVPASHIGLVSASQQDMVQLIADLMTRSRETLPMGGTVSIETSNFDLAPTGSNPIPDMPPGIYVLMTVKAEGHSVQPDQRMRSIQTIVERLSGWLEISGNAQSGVQYRVYMPRVEVLQPPS